MTVIPAEAGIQDVIIRLEGLDSRLRPASPAGGHSGMTTFATVSESVRLPLRIHKILLLSLVSFLVAILFSLALSDDAVVRHPYVLDTTYTGSHGESFQKLRWAIPGLIRQITINMAVRLGMDFQEGWQYPLSVGFVDGSPAGTENVLAYVQIYKDENGFGQRLNINLEAYDQQPFNYEKVFAHELVHAMMNDAIGGEAATLLPVWFHEGLAVYGADQGEAMLRSYVHQNYGFAESRLLNGIDGPHSAYHYAEDYLAMKFLNEKVGSNAFHNFVKDVIKRKGDIPGALLYTCFLKWEDFKSQALDYSKEEIKNIPPPQKGETDQPY